jgi:hypothetical protein
LINNNSNNTHDRVQSFSTVFLESIDEALSVLGLEPSNALFQYLLTICQLPRSEIPDRVQEFDNGLKKALGGASKVIERLILRKLFGKLSLAFRESEALEFTDYVDDAKRRFEIFSNKRSHASDPYETSRNISSKKGQVSG